ncbi:hypothetical protein MMC28_011069 [Mycoblastus sanguinarius]|nr:hypothetical protein [Mycoblastus sanguinarius]
MSLMVTNDLQTLNTSLNGGASIARSTAATTDPGEENDVIDTFDDLGTNVDQLMDDLVCQKEALVLSGQKQPIYDQLQTLYTGYTDYAIAIGDVLSNEAQKITFGQSAQQSIAKIAHAGDVYKPDTVKG